MNDLYSFHAQHRNTRVMHKRDHYFEVYERYLSPIRRSNPVVLEIGVQLGGSVEMWRDYFGPANIVSDFCRATKAITCFDSMIVYERARRPVPRHSRR